MCWLISDTTVFELPCAILSTLAEACEWLGIPLETAKTAFKRHGKYVGKKYQIDRVQIDK